MGDTLLDPGMAKREAEWPGSNESAEATVQTMGRVTRQKSRTEEKDQIVLDGLRGETSIAALGMNPYGVY